MKLAKAGRESKEVIQDDLTIALLPASKRSSVATGCFITGWDVFRPSACLDCPAHCRKETKSLATPSRQGREAAGSSQGRRKHPASAFPSHPARSRSPTDKGRNDS